MPTDPELHITVVAVTGEIELTEQIALVKAALLYADKVTLASPNVILLASFAAFLTAPASERRDALVEIAGHAAPDLAAAIPIWRGLREKKHKSGDEIITLRSMDRKLDAALADTEKTIYDMLEEAKAGEIERAMQAGVLDLDPLGTEDMSQAYTTDGLVRAMTTLIAQILSPASQTYPLFSEFTGGLAQAMVREGQIAGAELAPTTQAGIARRFIATIDAFPDAPMDVVLDARGKLREPLRGFRSGVMRLSRQLEESGISALDPQFERASADLYREHVAPALQEIDELSREMGLRNALLRTSPTVARDVLLATLALAVTTSGGIEDLAKLAVGAVGAAGDLLGRAALRQRELRGERDKNEFVFLFEGERQLS